MQTDDSERMLTLAVSLGVGVPGLVSLVVERAIAFEREKQREFHNTSVTTPIGYACYSSSSEVSGFEYGLCAPYFSYGRNHPRYGDRISVFIPLLCSVQLTRRGAMGVSVHLPLFLPFLRVGITVLIKNRRFMIISRTMFDGADQVMKRVLPAPRKKVA